MRLNPALAISLLAALTLGAQTRNDDAAIRALVAKYVAARDQTDAPGVAALFTADADQLVSTGEWRKGREEVVRGTMASSQASTGKRTIALEAIRFIGGDVALADGRYEIAATANQPARKMWTTLLVTRTSQGWRIAAIRNMLPAPAAGR